MSAGQIGGKTAFIGDQVRIVAKDDFYAYINGWEGTIQGLKDGHLEVVCQRDDGEKTFFVPGDQLAFVG